MKKSSALLPVLLALVACESRSSPATALTYPEARVGSASDVYHGTRIADPYRWLETLDATETQTWAAAQNTLMSSFIRSDSLYVQFLSRLKHHAKTWDAFNGGESEPPLIDSATVGARTLTRALPSPDNAYILYQLSSGGSEWVETRIRRRSDSTDSPETLEGMLSGAPVWSRDSKGFFYVHQRRGNEDERVMLVEPSVRYHVVGTPQSADHVVFATPRGSVESVLQVSTASNGRYLVITEGSGAVWEPFAWVESRLYLADLGNEQSPVLSNPVVPIIRDKIAGYRVLKSDGPILHLLTDRDAPRKRVVVMDIRTPAPERWHDFIPQDDKLVLHSMQRIGDRWVGVYLDDVQPLVRVYNRLGKFERSVSLPPLSGLLEISAGERDSEMIVMTSSFLRPPGKMIVDLQTGTTRVDPTATSDFDSEAFVESQQWYTSKDGTRIPMFLVHRKNIVLDGSHPVLMLGYGASGTIMIPEFAEFALAWLEAGGVFVMPNLRGGGEFGRSWYEAAILDRKQTTFDDFIAAAEWLIAKGYTRPNRLAIRGASNGGQLVSAVVTQRPDLFGAAIAEVPITDNLRYDRGRHRAQFGHVTDSAQFEVLYRYSPLHRVRTGVCYPSMLITTAMNDDRAPAWHALKFTAALQAAQRSTRECGRPILLRAADAGGHFQARGPDTELENQADLLTFLARQFGMNMALIAK